MEEDRKEDGPKGTSGVSKDPADRAMDAVREVVEGEHEEEAAEDRRRGRDGDAMDAVREIVEKEK